MANNEKRPSPSPQTPRPTPGLTPKPPNIGNIEKGSADPPRTIIPPRPTKK